MAISEPINPLVAHLGAGVLQLRVENPVSGTLARYEIRCARALAGPYSSYSSRFFTLNDAFIYGFAIGLTAYIQVRAIGTDGSESDWVQARLGQIQTCEVMAECSCIAGSRIPAGAMFVVPKMPDRLAGLVAVNEINF